MLKENLQVLKDVSDSWFWLHSPSGDYMTKSGYQSCAQGDQSQNVHSIFTEVWHLKIPSWVTCFMSSMTVSILGELKGVRC